MRFVLKYKMYVFFITYVLSVFYLIHLLRNVSENSGTPDVGVKLRFFFLVSILKTRFRESLVQKSAGICETLTTSCWNV